MNHTRETIIAPIEDRSRSRAERQSGEPRAAGGASLALAVPRYLEDTYWWAYVHPRAVRVFERQWLVNLILWGNFDRLRDEALDALGDCLPGHTVQIACVYGDLTARLMRRVDAAGGKLDVVDILPVQLQNLRRKLPANASARLLQRDSQALGYADASIDRALLFFLLHEQPEEVRRQTIAEALRVVRPGGRLVIVDYHRPHLLHPLRPLMAQVLRRLEPYAIDLWEKPVDDWFPAGFEAAAIERSTSFGGLYQKLVISV